MTVNKQQWTCHPKSRSLNHACTPIQTHVHKRLQSMPGLARHFWCLQSWADRRTCSRFFYVIHTRVHRIRSPCWELARPSRHTRCWTVRTHVSRLHASSCRSCHQQPHKHRLPAHPLALRCESCVFVPLSGYALVCCVCDLPTYTGMSVYHIVCARTVCVRACMREKA